MSPQDTVERVLKEIHVTFSQCPTYNGEPDKIIVDRKHFLQLLDRLNQGIYDMMEKYEQTRQSRMTAERAFKKKGEEILNQANASAEDIYAASVLYTADAIGRIRELMDQTNDSMNDLFIQFRRDLRARKDVLRAHESELQAQLVDLADSHKYLSVLKDINREQDKVSLDNKARREIAEFTDEKDTHIPAQAVDVKVNEEYFKKAGKEAPKAAAADGTATEKPEVVVNQDAAYFKWKAQQEAKADKEAKAAEEAKMPEDEAKVEKADAVKADETETAERAEAAVDVQEKPEQSQEPSSNGQNVYYSDDPDEEGISEHERLIRQIMREQAQSGMFAANGQTDASAQEPAVDAEPVEESYADIEPEEASYPDTEFAQESYTDLERGDDVDAGEEAPNGEFPDEESIRQAVLQDELAYEEAHRPARERESAGPGHILKTLLFGKDEE